MFKSFNVFLKESETVKLKKELSEYTLVELSDGNFSLASDKINRHFSVLPYKSEVADKIRNLYPSMIDALDNLHVVEMYNEIEKAERLDYNYGGLFRVKANLEEAVGVSFTTEQLSELRNSQKRFLLNNFSGLSKDTRDLITDYLRHRLEILCVVIQALFFYIRKHDKKNFFNGLNKGEIIEKYEEAMKNASEKDSFNFEGPYKNATSKDDINDDADVAFWHCEKGGIKFILKGTISPKSLYDEERVGGIKTFKMSICEDGSETTKEEFSTIDVENLEEKIAEYCKYKKKYK